MLKQLFILLLCTEFFLPAHSEEVDHEIHTELRALLSGVETAINSKRYADLKPYFHTDLRVTTVNQNTILSLDEIDSYFTEWFGKGGYIKTLQMNLKPDALTELYHDKTMGIVRGSGVEQYKLADGRDLHLDTRWTATLLKGDDAKWRILTLHLGTNFYDNPIYNETRKFLIKVGIIGSIAGLFFGLLIGFLLWREK